VQAQFLDFVGLGLLNLADYYGRIASQLALEAGKDVASIVAALGTEFGVAAATVEQWLSGASQAFATWVDDVEHYLGLGLDFACYVEIDNRNGSSDLVLAGQSVTHGSYVVGPPSRIPQGTHGRLVLKDPKPSIFGSEGTVTYNYADANFATKTVVFSFACPTGFDPNKAASNQSAWKCFAKSSDANFPWSSTVPGGGHPLFVDYVTSGQPRPPAVERIVTQTRRAGGGKILGLCHPGESWSPIAVRDAIAEIRRGDHRYIAVDAAGGRSSIVVVNGRHGPYLRSRADATAQNNLAQLPPC